MKQERFYRSALIEESAIDVINRRVQVAFSSATPVERSYGLEVLSHNPADVDLSFLSSGSAPVLEEHDIEEIVGVIESAVIDNGIGRAILRFSKSEDGSEVFDDIVDGIRKNISVGYVVTNRTVDTSGAFPVVLCQWKPVEISIVSIPADENTGVGRSLEQELETQTPSLIKENKMENTENTTVETRALDIEVVRAEIQKDERARVSAISELATRHNVQNIAGKFISEGKSVDEFRSAILDTLSARPAVSTSAAIGMSEKEVRSYDLGKAVKALVTGDWSDAGLELEASKTQARADGKMHQNSSFFVPTEYFKRSMSKAGTNVGSQLVGTDLMASEFQDVLFNNSIAKLLGVRYMSGLVGDVDFPRFTSGAGVYEVAEGDDVTQSTPGTGLVELTPRTFGVLVEYTRRMAQQSTPIVEGILRTHIQNKLAEKIDQIVFEKIFADTSINWVSLGATGGPISFADLKKVVSNVEVANALTNNAKWAINPLVSYLLETTLKGTNTAAIYLKEGSNIGSYPALSSNNVPSNLTKSTATDLCGAVFGDFSNVLVGQWGGVELAVDTSQKFASGGYLLRALTDLNAIVLRDAAFSGFKDVAVA